MMPLMSETKPQQPPSPQQLPDTWDAVAPTYAEDVAQWSDYASEALRMVPVASTDRVLDVACGPGTLAFLAASRAARVDAVDFSPGMIEQLRSRASREGVKNIEGAVMDAQKLELPDATFDAAFNLFSFFFFQDRARAFRELHRVLKPGGRALVATWAPIERRPVMQIGFEAMAEALPQLPRPAKGDLQDPEECVREMTDGGFRDVTARTFTASVHIDSAEHYVDMIVRSGAPFVVMRKKMGEEGWKAVRGKLLEAVRKRLPGAADLSAEAILTTATR
jgi:ubiquinone/menaquinone biosynthesis C-methylase UbiE